MDDERRGGGVVRAPLFGTSSSSLSHHSQFIIVHNIKDNTKNKPKIEPKLINQSIIHHDGV